MQRITRETVLTLTGHTGFPCVSIYIPTEGAGPLTAGDQTAVKSAMQRARNLLIERGVRREDARRILRSIPELADDAGAWHESGAGVAMFLAPGWFRGYRFAGRLAPTVYVGSRFLTRQLWPQIRVADHLMVLAVSGRWARLIDVSGENVAELPAGLPQGPGGLPWRSEAEPDLQFHQLGRAATAHGQPLYHGHGAATDSTKERSEEYLNYVEALLRPVLMARGTPLVLAGVESVVVTYRKLNTYPHLIKAAVAGNPDDLSATELGERALGVAHGELQREYRTAASRHARLAGSARTLTNLQEILPAAFEGRVLHLFLANEAESWGRFDQPAGRIDVLARDEVHAEDLLDVSAQETLAKGGDVYAVPLEEMPGDPPHKAAVAVLRF
jgi:hypothetical protein